MTRRKRSSGDVFQDLGFSPEESAHLRIRSELMRAARKVIDERRLTQAKAAALFGVTQPRVSDLVRGKMSLFSIRWLDRDAECGRRARRNACCDRSRRAEKQSRVVQIS